MTECKVFLRKPQFTGYVANLKPEFDAKATNGLPQFYFVDIHGVLTTTRCAKDYFIALNERFGYFIDPDKSTTRRNRWVVTFDDTPPTPVVKETKISLVAMDEEDTVESDEGIVATEDEQEATGEVLIETEYVSFDEVDWPRVEALKNTKSDKSELDLYAAKFGVSLKKNKSISNMLADFKEAAGVE